MNIVNVVATIEVDLEVTPLGTKSRVAGELHGQSLLRRTVERVRQCRLIRDVFILCAPWDEARCRRLIEGTGALLRTHQGGPPPWRTLVQSARKWSLDGWRGGIGGTTGFDEYTDCRVLSGLLKSIDAEAVLSIPPACPLFNPALNDRLIKHCLNDEEQSRITFTQAPPGLTGILIRADWVHKLASQGSPLGWTLSYKPDSPQRDVIFLSSCCPIPAELRHATGRLIGDTNRAMETLHALLEAHPELDTDADAPMTIGRWLQQRERDWVPPIPREVEIELTTNDPYPDTILRPRSQRVGQRGPIELTIVQQVAQELSGYDDSLVILGGFGDPLRHPQWADILSAIRPDGVSPIGAYGLAIRTNGVDLTDQVITTLIEHKVDILEVTLDAWSNETYAQLQTPGAEPDEPEEHARLEHILARLERLAQTKQEHFSPRPLVLPAFTKVKDNVHEMDNFYDGWIRRVGAAAITGYSHCAQQLPDRAVMSMAPPARFGCRRIDSRCVVLADGRVTVCDQDFRGLHTFGRIGEQTLEEIWNGPGYQNLRRGHDEARYDVNPLCTACNEWHRP